MWAISIRSVSAERNDIRPCSPTSTGVCAVQSGDRQPFVDQPVAVARPHPERVAGLVADGFFGQAEIPTAARLLPISAG